jgi:hypothetical protein
VLKSRSGAKQKTVDELVELGQDWLRARAEEEHQERAGHLVFIKADLPMCWLDRVEMVESESSYRRGYSQGYWTAIEDAKKLTKSPKLERLTKFWLKLSDWRYLGKLTSMELPPEFDH